MNLQRYVFAFMLALQAALAGAITSDTFPAWTKYLMLVGLFLGSLMQALTQSVSIPKDDPASKVSTSMRPPKLPMLCLALALLPGCAWFATNKPALVPVEVALCVFGAEEAGLSPEASAVYCKVGIDVVNGLLADKHAKARATRAAQVSDAGTDGAK